MKLDVYILPPFAPSKSTRRNMGSAFNQTASDFLHDIGRVFPDNQTVAKASALVSAAVSMDENTFVPALVFMDGKPESEWKTMERQMFQIPLTAFQSEPGQISRCFERNPLTHSRCCRRQTLR